MLVALGLTLLVVLSLAPTAIRNDQPLVLLLIPPGLAAIALRRARADMALAFAVAHRRGQAR